MTGAVPPLLQNAFNENTGTALLLTPHFQKAEKGMRLEYTVIPS
jgi:hypothetical protein